MTEQQSTTYLAFDSFPSDPKNQFKSIRGEVSTEIFDDGDIDLTIAFTVANHGNVVEVRFDAYATTTEDDTANRESLADLEFLNNEWTAFYTAAKAAFDDILPAD